MVTSANHLSSALFTHPAEDLIASWCPLSGSDSCSPTLCINAPHSRPLFTLAVLPRWHSKSPSYFNFNLHITFLLLYVFASKCFTAAPYNYHLWLFLFLKKLIIPFNYVCLQLTKRFLSLFTIRLNRC